MRKLYRYQRRKAISRTVVIVLALLSVALLLVAWGLFSIDSGPAIPAPPPVRISTAGPNGLPPTEITGTDGAPMVLIPAGSIPANEDGTAADGKAHRVSVDAFYMDKYLVTNERFARFLNAWGRDTDEAGHEMVATCMSSGILGGGVWWYPDPGYEHHPSLGVTWYGAVQFAKYYGKRLPREAEWELACRAGSDSKWCFGDDEGRLAEYAWYGANSGGTTHPVGVKAANAFGLYDIHGNVWEWCDGRPAASTPDQSQPLRGGAYGYTAGACECATNTWEHPGEAGDFGFRCVVSGGSPPLHSRSLALGWRASMLWKKLLATSISLGLGRQDDILPGSSLVDGVRKFGFKDRAQRFVIRPQFDAAGYFVKGIAPAKIGGKWGFIDRSGAFVIKPRFLTVWCFSEGRAAAEVGDPNGQSTGLYGYIDMSGDFVIAPQFTFPGHFRGGRAFVANEKGRWCIDRSGRVVFEHHFDEAWGFSEGLSVVKSGGAYGYVDRSGKTVIKPQFGLARSFREGLAVVRMRGQYAYIDRSGKPVTKLEFDEADQFEEAMDFGEGLAAVKIDGKYGFINRHGKLVISPRFTFVHAFHRGRAVVNIDAEEYFLSKRGGLTKTEGGAWITWYDSEPYCFDED